VDKTEVWIVRSLAPVLSFPFQSGLTSQHRVGVGNAGGLEVSLTHTSNSVDKCQLIVGVTGMVNLRRTPVGESEHQLQSLNRLRDRLQRDPR